VLSAPAQSERFLIQGVVRGAVVVINVSGPLQARVIFSPRDYQSFLVTSGQQIPFPG
jgi:hypothetical protein